MQMDLSKSQNGELRGVSEMKRLKEEDTSQTSDLTMQVSSLKIAVVVQAGTPAYQTARLANLSVYTND